MSQKSWYVLRIVVSLYLAYLGIQLILDVVEKRPGNMVFMLVMAGVFIVTGVLYGIYSVKKVWSLRNEGASEAQNDNEVIEEGTEENNKLKNEEDNAAEQDDSESTESEED